MVLLGSPKVGKLTAQKAMILHIFGVQVVLVLIIVGQRESRARITFSRIAPHTGDLQVTVNEERMPCEVRPHAFVRFKV